jgi:hypothetical protein
MSGVQEHVARVARLDDEGKRRAGALLLVRYCGWHGDPKFRQWFGQSREALEHTAAAGRALLRGEVCDLDNLRAELDEALEAVDPDGPPFEAEITDHLVFATEVLDFLLTPEDGDASTQVFERSDELAEAHDDMAREELPEGHELPSVDFLSRESAVRDADTAEPLDRAAALVRSEEFAQLYAAVIQLGYSDEDAGITCGEDTD